MRWVGHVACMEEGTGVYSNFSGADNIKMDLREIG
jgi:hypothetical protein